VTRNRFWYETHGNRAPPISGRNALGSIKDVQEARVCRAPNPEGEMSAHIAIRR